MRQHVSVGVYLTVAPGCYLNVKHGVLHFPVILSHGVDSMQYGLCFLTSRYFTSEDNRTIKRFWSFEGENLRENVFESKCPADVRSD